MSEPIFILTTTSRHTNIKSSWLLLFRLLSSLSSSWPLFNHNNLIRISYPYSWSKTVLSCCCGSVRSTYDTGLYRRCFTQASQCKWLYTAAFGLSSSLNMSPVDYGSPRRANYICRMSIEAVAKKGKANKQLTLTLQKHWSWTRHKTSIASRPEAQNASWRTRAAVARCQADVMSTALSGHRPLRAACKA